MSRVYKIRTNRKIEYTDTNSNPVDNFVENSENTSVENPQHNQETIIEYAPENLDKPSDTLNITLTDVPSFEETIESTTPVDKSEILDEIQPLLSIPDRWHIQLPEDKNLAPLLNFYKDNNIVTTFPLNPENLNAIMPILDTFYERPEPEEKPKPSLKLKRWIKKHKFTSALAGLLILIVGAAMTVSIVTYIQY